VGVVSVPSPDAWRPQLQRIVGAYRHLGVSSSAIASRVVTEVTPRIAHVTVTWELLRANGSTVYAFTASYTVADTDGGPRIVAIAHDETPKLTAAVAALTAPS
jgi:hypothetical protein